MPKSKKKTKTLGIIEALFCALCLQEALAALPENSPSSCSTISRGVISPSSFPDSESQKFTEKLIDFLNVKDHKNLQLLFHEKLAAKVGNVETSMQLLPSLVGKLSGVSVYRAWLVTIPNENSGFVSCPDEEIVILPHHGYQKQLYFIFQLIGEKELARLYLTAVNTNSTWKIGSWHLQVWTHGSCDPQCQIDEALRESKNKQKIPALVRLDLAQKLLTSSGYFTYKKGNEIKKILEDTGFKEGLLSIVSQAAGPKYKIRYASSAFAKDGPGLLVRYDVNNNLPLNSLKDTCFDLVRSLSTAAELDTIGGVYCGYLKPEESSEKDGVLGSRFVSRSEIKSLLGASQKTLKYRK